MLHSVSLGKLLLSQGLTLDYIGFDYIGFDYINYVKKFFFSLGTVIFLFFFIQVLYTLQ